MSQFFKVVKNFTHAQLGKQLPFATAVALTKTAKEAQSGVIDGLGDKFTLRNNWWRPSTPLGIRIKPATKTNLVAEVGTDFDAIEKFETGKDKTPRGRFLAIPTENVRRNKKQIILKLQRPKNLPRSFVLQTKNGPVLFQRKFKGKRSRAVAVYNLEKKAKIRKNSPVIEPAVQVINRRLNQNFLDALDRALKTAK